MFSKGATLLLLCCMWGVLNYNEAAITSNARAVVRKLQGQITEALKPRVITNKFGRKFIVREPTDVFFLADRSGSIGRNDFEIIRKFMSVMLSDIGLVVGPSTSHGAVVTFATNVVTNVNYVSRAKSHCHFVAAILGIPYTGGMTNTNGGFKRIKQLIQQSMRSRPQGKKLVFYLTDGRYNVGGNPSSTIYQIKRLGDVTIFSFGVGTNVNDHHLKSTSTHGYWHHLRDFQTLNAVVRVLKAAVGIRQNRCASGSRGSVLRCRPLETTDGVSQSDCSGCPWYRRCTCRITTGQFFCKNVNFLRGRLHPKRARVQIKRIG